MKTEDIDKKIGMPDVDAEWAKFEHEVIDKETASHKRVMLWGLSIAASIALVAGIFLYGHDVEEQAETLVAVAEKSATPATHEAPATEPETESVSETEKAPMLRKFLTPRRLLIQRRLPRRSNVLTQGCWLWQHLRKRRKKRCPTPIPQLKTPPKSLTSP